MKWDAEQIKNLMNCRDVVERDIGAPKHHGSKYSMYRCPLHSETKGYSLAVYDDHWQCYGKCNTGGDVIQWTMAFRHLSFNEACIELGGQLTNTMSHRPRTFTDAPEPPSEPPPAEWQMFAHEVVGVAEQLLWSPDGKRAMDYLKDQRGLTRAAIKDARLGYIPALTDNDYKYGRVIFPNWLKEDGKPVRIACGIVMPHFASDALWAVRVRRPPGVEGSKYMGVSGGSKVVYRIDQVLPRCPVVITEGEFDALVLDQAAGYIGSMVQAVALCSASNKHIHSRWLEHLVTAPVILARLDNDAAGERAAEVLKALSGRVRSIQVPAPHKDITDFYMADGMIAVRNWIEEQVTCR
jgi:DNA primase